MEKRRIEAVDYLRGCMALAIMLYHFTSWTSGAPDGNSVLGRLGIYGVSIFYILSGMSLYVAYSETSWSRSELLTFWKRRFFRIAPVYWAACLGVIVLFKGYETFSIGSIIGNLTLTFGFLDYAHYIPTGGWSIGNEICFYMIFPILLISSKNVYLFAALCLAFLSAYLWFAFFSLTADSPLAAQWAVYIHPLNQAFLFVGGIIVAKVSTHARHLPPSRIACIALLTASLVGLFLYGDIPEAIGLVTSTNRVAFTVLCLTACYACFNLNASGASIFERALKHLGEISYSIYLLHALLFFCLQKLLYRGFVKNLTPTQFAFLVVAPIVLIAATYCYRMIEKPFIRLGKINTGTFRDRVRIAFTRPATRVE